MRRSWRGPDGYTGSAITVRRYDSIDGVVPRDVFASDTGKKLSRSNDAHDRRRIKCSVSYSFARCVPLQSAHEKTRMVRRPANHG